MMNDQDFADLLPEYVLGALSAAETKQVELWLATSEEARAELAEYRAMMTAVTTLTEPRPAPARMSADFQQRLAEYAKTNAVSTNVQHVVPRQTIWLGLAAMFIIGMGLYAVYAWVNGADSRRIQAIRSDPAAITIALNNQDNAPGHASFIIVPGGTQAVLSVDLPKLASDKMYEFWVINTIPVNSGIFTTDNRPKDLLLTIPHQLNTYKVLAITVEPRSEKGSDAPTSKPILVGNIPS